MFVLDVPEDSIPPSVADSVSDDIGGNLQCENHISHLNEDEFRRKYRMSRKNFHSLLDLIKYHPVFDPRGGYKRRGPIQSPKTQLLTMLHHICHVNCTASSSRSTHFLGHGTLYLYLERIITAITSLRDNVTFWPDEAKRRLISDRMEKKYDFTNCVSMGDSTLFPLAFSPTSHDPSDITLVEKWVTVLRGSS